MRESSARNPSLPPPPPADSVELSTLLQRASKGDQGAWEELLQLYSRRVYALARSRLRNDHLAEELTQSVFCTVASKLATTGYTEQGKFEPWLFRVAINRIRDHVRSMQRRGPIGSDAALEGVAAAPNTTGAASQTDSDVMQALRGAMESIGDADRQVVELRHQAGLSFAQIAEILDEPIGTLLARHHRALRKLKSILESAGVSISGMAAADSSTQIKSARSGVTP